MPSWDLLLFAKTVYPGCFGASQILHFLFSSFTLFFCAFAIFILSHWGTQVEEIFLLSGEWVVKQRSCGQQNFWQVGLTFQSKNHTYTDPNLPLNSNFYCCIHNGSPRKDLWFHPLGLWARNSYWQASQLFSQACQPLFSLYLPHSLYMHSLIFFHFTFALKHIKICWEGLCRAHWIID